MATTSATTGIFSGGDARVIFAAARSMSSPLERRRRRRRRRRLTVARTTTTPDGDDDDDEGNDHHHHHQGFENVKDAAMATCVRALAKLDVLDYHDVATRKPTTVRDATSDDDATTINIYGHVATIDLKETKDALDEQFIRRLHEPVVVRNASSMASRDAFDKTRDDERWTLRKLLEAYEEEEKRTGGTFQTNVRVRVRSKSCKERKDVEENTKSFVYAEQSHEAIRNGKFQPPSLTLRMPFANGLARVLELSGDGAYIQSELPITIKEEMKREYSRVFSAFDRSNEFIESQPLRLWLSKAGSISPLHFDASISTLTQLKGQKTFLLFSPFSGLSKCFLYPDWHPLRRRSRLSIDDERIRNELRAYKATLSEGDVLIFPPRWLHHVESSNKTNTSISITRRYVQTVPKHVHVDTSYASRFAKWAKTRDKGTKALRRLYSTGLMDPDFPTRFNLSVVDLDEDGKCPKLCEMRTFENDAQEKWKFCVKSMSDCILARMNVSSICVRGSIARGAAVDFESDCDLVVVFENERADDQQINDLRSELESIRAKEFPFAKKIDVRFEVRGQMDAEQLFTLAASSLCVSGEDIPKSLSRMAPVRACFPTLREDVFLALENKSEKAISWAAKRCLRAAFESQKRTRFTREISRCCEIVCEEDYSKKKYEAGDLETALVIAVKGPKTVFGEVYWLEMTKALLERLSKCILLAT
tara:strand:- start:1900 stop:4011 length:2112 start_codon:yes stop_codon:yes gene_type:complete